MVWAPANKTIYSRAVASNLLAYFADATRQADAIAWAHGSALRPFQNISNSIANRAVPVYPSIAFADDDEAQDPTGDILLSAYSVTFELLIQNSDPGIAVTEARSYAKAVVSMILNCPLSTLAASTGANVNATSQEGFETAFEEIKTNDIQNDFLQTVKIKAAFVLRASAY